MKATHRNLFHMGPPDGCGRCTGACGDSIEVQLRIRDDHIEQTAFTCEGCLSTALAATAVTDLVRGARLSQALQLTALNVIDHVGDLGEEHEHCAVIAVNALHDAVSDALAHRAEPWKQLYRT